jgi:UDP-N-acetylmuramoylalanine-D-glutamate ligase
MVVGMARSGLAAVQLLTQLGAHPIATDSKTEEQLSETLRNTDGRIAHVSLAWILSRCYLRYRPQSSARLCRLILRW